MVLLLAKKRKMQDIAPFGVRPAFFTWFVFN